LSLRYLLRQLLAQNRLNLIAGTAFVADIVKQNESFMDGQNECIGVGVGAYCRSELKQDEQFCVSLCMAWPMIQKEFYFKNDNGNIKDAKLSFWGARSIQNIRTIMKAYSS